MSDNGNSGKIDAVGAVMVVGGGIAGMQSAIDLVNSGFKVYLVEETSSLGGRMSQLDKTFPTNDCSMCLISPRLIEVGKNHNIDLMTNTEVQSIEGEKGNFKVRVLKKPRYIDEKKCSGCGDCVEACPVSLVNEFEQALTTRKAAYRRYPQAVPNSMAISKAARPPCKLNCPAGCNGQGYVALISQGKYVEAVNHIKQWIPLPAALGRICQHPCESACNRSDVDQPVAMAALKRFVADNVRQKRQDGSLPPEAKPVIDPTKPKVAIVGSGPSGLTCAYDLAKKGYPVMIFEASSSPGGQLQSSIPGYRLPKDVLAAEIKDILDTGIDLRLNTRIGKELSLAQLRQDYSAVYLAIGAQKGRSLAIPGAELSGVWQALDFLRAVNQGDQVQVGKKVVVIGGGNTAMDAARTAARLGASEVTIAYRRSRNEMPASDEEIEQAEQEGIHFNYLSAPLEIEAAEGKIGSLKCIKMALGQPDSSGRPKAEPVAGSEFFIPADTVIIAVGQEVDLSFLPANTGIKTGREGVIAVDSTTLATGEPGVFAGGDGVTGPKSAVEAIYHGHEAAISIERYLNKVDLSQGRRAVKEDAAPTPEGEHERKPRLHLKRIPADRRTSTFDEVEIGYTEDEAKAESSRCLNCGLCSECLQCVAACKANAIDHAMKPQTIDVSVGSIVLAPGFEPFDARLKGEYGYGRMPNVVTSLEFERILSASGPFQGQVRRPSDHKHPVNIAWIQCVGSRDETCGRGYCSSVCCMYATKEAVIAREHDSAIKPTIFYNDMRAFGKGFERYYVSARDRCGVRYIKSLVSSVKELQQSHNLLIEYTTAEGKKVAEEFDMVVLSIGLVPSASARTLAERLAIETDQFGFCKTEEFRPNETSRPGIYVAGAFETPMDIPEAVMGASSAACLASQDIATARGTLLTQKTYPPETPLDGAEPRVGVFICRCGANIARVVDVPGVAAYAGALPHVVHAEENLYTCSTDTQNKIIKTIKEKGLNRVVVASCSPRTHEPLFQDTIREGGLNKFLFEMANIRDQCSWVHATHPQDATEKAKDLVRMAVASAATLRPLPQTTVPLTPKALVIGGGLSGITAALALAAQGFESVLVERQKDLGGNLRHIYYTADGSDPQALLASLVKQVAAEPKITICKGAEVKNISGFLGNFKTEIAAADGKTREVEHGVVILATGGVEYKPTEYLYGQSPKVMTQTELEERLARGSHDTRKLKSVVMIQCVGSREEAHMYCSRVCCTQAMTNAVKIKKQSPDTEVYVLYRDIRTYGKRELLYREARELGVLFVRFDEAHKPEVSQANDRLTVRVMDSALGTVITLEADLLVLSSAIRPQPDAPEFASRLKLPLTQDKFYMEAHMKLRPLDFVNEGMYLCGLAHSPKSIGESIAQARGAVSRALTVLSQPCLTAGGIVAVVDPERCVACLTCVRACPYQVPRVNVDGVACIEAAACQGCGICASSCPRKAIRLQHFEDEQILAKTSVLIG